MVHEENDFIGDSEGGTLVQLDSETLSLAKQWYGNFKKYVKEVLVE